MAWVPDGFGGSPMFRLQARALRMAAVALFFCFPNSHPARAQVIGSFTQLGGTLVGSGATGASSQQGWSVALSGDGNTALAGAPFDGSTGAVWVFLRNSDGTWSQQGSKLSGNGVSGNADQGWSVAL